MKDFPSVQTSRRITMRRVVHELMSRGAISRAELAREIGLSKQTMSDVFRDLQRDGWVKESGRRQGPLGRSAKTYSVSPRRALVFGADVGGTKIRAALADMTGEIVEEAVVATDPSGGDRVISQIASLAAALSERAGLSRGDVLVGTIGIPGAFDPRSGRLAMVPNIDGLEGIGDHREVRARVGVSCPHR